MQYFGSFSAFSYNKRLAKTNYKRQPSGCRSKTSWQNYRLDSNEQAGTLILSLLLKQPEQKLIFDISNFCRLVQPTVC